MTRFLQRAGFALAALLLPTAACTQTSAGQTTATVDPALWLVSDDDTTIYLFGSFHLLPADIDWFAGDVREAFESADELVVEVLPPADGGAATVQRLARAEDGVALTERLSDEQAARLAEAFEAAGIPLPGFEDVDPWFAVITLSVLEYRKLGMSPDSGVEMTLIDAARETGKPMEDLETFEQQMRFFEDMPMEQQVAMLGETLDQLESIPEQIDALVADWAEGDVQGFAARFNEGFADNPELRAILLTDRNRNWAEWIDARLDEPGAVFVAVGAGHLAGEGSVQSFLAERGIETRRLDQVTHHSRPGGNHEE